MAKKDIAVVASAPPEIPAGVDLDIPHHMQDKDGFCGAACVMMLLARAGIIKSQSEIMRLIKLAREDIAAAAGAKPASCRVAWHASPEEIAMVLDKLIGQEAREPVFDTDSLVVMRHISKALDDKCGAIALVWAPKIGTTLPHWVVVTGKTTDPRTGEVSGYWILDPTAPGRPDAALRYEAIEHVPVKDSETCFCQMWKDESGMEQTALRVWVPVARLEEMLDEGAVRGVGLRYAIIGPAGLQDDDGKVRTKGATRGPHRKEDCPEDRTVEGKIRRRRLKERAKIFFETAEAAKGIPVKVVK